ncbi:nucleotidyltransferase [Mycoplasmopsis gallinarum]|uniref:nucleotidyltransferase n=1 Tax=Mycoplasmopsis gallinarum TaxID=29557 RepID=UPI0018E6AA75
MFYNKYMPVGIVVEYNPFHNGHLRQLNWIKRKWPNEKIIIVMSDKFTQRGEYNVLSFRKRKSIAHNFGVSKVLKLKFEESCQAAHIFARNSILRLNKFGIDKLVFGSETDNVDEMIYLAKFLKSNQNKYNELVRSKMKKDKLAYPKATSEALKELTGKNFTLPNDILGFEYIKTIVEFDLPITPFIIHRNIGFHSTETHNNFASASLIRQLAFNNKDYQNYIPYKKIKLKNKNEYLYKKFKKKILKLKTDDFKKIPLISEGIENLLIKNLNELTYENFINKCTSKRYTASRIKRIIAWIVNYRKGKKYEKMN